MRAVVYGVVVVGVVIAVLLFNNQILKNYESNEYGKIDFRTLEKGCYGSESSGVNITKDKEVVVIEGVVTLPNPCYKIIHKTKIDENTLVVELYKDPNKPIMCVQCVGYAKYRIISDVVDRVVVKVDGNIVVDQEV